MSASSANPADPASSPSRVEVLRNLIGALPVAAWFGIGAWASWEHLRLMPDFSRQTFAARVATVADIFAIVLFCALIVLLLARRTPVASLPGLAPKFFAALGFAFPFVLVAMPEREASDAARFSGSLCGLAGTAFALAGLAYLRRNFSILPQARALVTEGPYALIRHPVYAAELLIFVGAALERAGAWTWALAPLAVLVQVPRMRFEEALLRRTFPEYRAYEARTRYRLVPGLY